MSGLEFSKVEFIIELEFVSVKQLILTFLPFDVLEEVLGPRIGEVLHPYFAQRGVKHHVQV